jgi:hypothetical protein
MSDAAGRAPEPSGPWEHSESDAPRGAGAADADAWARACEEDLEAEKARRRAQYGSYGQQPGSAAEELRRLAEAVSEKVAEFGRPFAGAAASGAAQGVARELIQQAKSAFEPVVERNPQVFDHLASAGGELLAAYRAAVTDAERRWTARQPGTGAGSGSGSGSASAGTGSAPEPGTAPGPGSGPVPERIDLDKDDPGERPGGADGV